MIGNREITTNLSDILDKISVMFASTKPTKFECVQPVKNEYTPRSEYQHHPSGRDRHGRSIRF